MRRFVRFQSSVSLTLVLLLASALTSFAGDDKKIKKTIPMRLAIGTSAVRSIGFRWKKRLRWASSWRSRWSVSRKLSMIR